MVLGNLFLVNATIVLENSILEQGFIHIKDDKIETVGEMAVCPSRSDDEQVFDCAGMQYVIPGMIDIHVHGAAGFDFMDGSHEAFEGIAKALAKEGTTSFLATTITNPIEHTVDALKSLEKYSAQSTGLDVAEMLGIHLEGPFINKQQKGAQPESAIITPDAKVFREWQELSGNAIKVITFAPELDAQFELLQELTKTGVIPSMGHTDGLMMKRWMLSVKGSAMQRICLTA